jgi:ferrochelatase
VRPFLENLFSDPMIIRLPLARVLQSPLARGIAATRAGKVRRAYAMIGGGSPLLRLTRLQAAALGAELARRGRPVRVEVIMRYTEPSASTVLRNLRAEGVSRAVVLPLYPHECEATTGSGIVDVEGARKRLHPELALKVVRSYHRHPQYIGAIVSRIRAPLASLRPEGRGAAVLLFSAHGVPESLPRRGDPYVTQIRETVEDVLRTLGAPNPHRLGFQSRTGPVRWVGPSTDEVIRDLPRGSDVIVIPIAFVSDHIETLYEIDILLEKSAREAGIGAFLRTESLNDDPLFIAALADVATPLLDEPL